MTEVAKKKRIGSILAILGVIFLVFILDQFTKIFMMDLLSQGFCKEPILPFFNIVERWNRGISFGLFGKQSLSPWVFIGFTGSICLGLFVWYLKETTILMCGALGFIIGGALGNAQDRFLYGAVFDFLEFHVSGYYWPAFNLADSAIVLGVSLLFFKSLIKTKQDEVISAPQGDGK